MVLRSFPSFAKSRATLNDVKNAMMIPRTNKHAAVMFNGLLECCNLNIHLMNEYKIHITGTPIKKNNDVIAQNCPNRRLEHAVAAKRVVKRSQHRIDGEAQQPDDAGQREQQPIAPMPLFEKGEWPFFHGGQRSANGRVISTLRSRFAE